MDEWVAEKKDGDWEEPVGALEKSRMADLELAAWLETHCRAHLRNTLLIPWRLFDAGSVDDVQIRVPGSTRLHFGPFPVA